MGLRLNCGGYAVQKKRLNCGEFFRGPAGNNQQANVAGPKPDFTSRRS